MSKIFLIPLRYPLKIKAVELASVFKAGIDHPLGLLKVKAGNLRRILIVVRVKREKKNTTKSHRINNLYATDKRFSRQLLENHLKLVVRMFSSSPDERISGMIAYKCIKIAFSPIRSIQICIFKHIGFC